MNPLPYTNSPSLAIVVGLKFSDGGTYAVDQAARIAQRVTTSTLHLVHVFETPLSAKEAEAMREHLTLYANEKAASLGGLGSRMMGIHLRSGNAALAIAQFATDIDAGIIVIGAERHPILALFAARTSDKLAPIAPCPVLVAGPKPLPIEAMAPVIEPPCPGCVGERFATHGQRWWCARHSERALHGHTFSYQRELPFATKDSNLGPQGI